MAAPVFYLLAGPNGAGKSTLYRGAVAQGLIPAEAEFVNADLYEAGHLHHVGDLAERSRQARQWADARRAQCLAEGRSFASETVFSHTSKLDLMSAAQRTGFAVVLMVVCVDDPQQLLGRVSQRVEEGGHPVPPERILARCPRTVRHLGGPCGVPIWRCSTTPRCRRSRCSSRHGWWRACAVVSWAGRPIRCLAGRGR